MSHPACQGDKSASPSPIVSASLCPTRSAVLKSEATEVGSANVARSALEFGVTSMMDDVDRLRDGQLGRERAPVAFAALDRKWLAHSDNLMRLALALNEKRQSPS
jgi:hypothetical protein